MPSARERLRDPVLWIEVAQIAKTAGAAVLAWLLAGRVLGVAQPFLAPWAALLTVNATVYRTLSRGIQQVAAAVLGVLLAFAVGHLLGVGALGLGIALLVALAAGRSPALRPESTTAAATALVVLLTGYSGEGDKLAARLLDTVIGIAVGLLVNLVVWPPLRDRAAARRVDLIDDRLAELLSAMAERLGHDEEPVDVEPWVDRTRELDHDIDEAWAVVRQARESGRLNLRRGAAARIRASEGFAGVLARLEQATAETRSMARTIGRAGASPAGWDPRFRAVWIALLAQAAAASGAADAAGLTRLRVEIDAAVRELSESDGSAVMRPVHGALLVNLRNIADAMEAVADAQPVRPATRSPGGRRFPGSGGPNPRV